MSNSVNYRFLTAVLPVCLMTGCGGFSNRPPDAYLDNSDCLVGTIVVHREKAVGVLAVEAPDKTGLRRLWHYETLSSSSDREHLRQKVNEAGKTPSRAVGGHQSENELSQAKPTELSMYLYQIAGRHFAFIGFSPEGPFNVVLIEFDGRVFSFRHVVRSLLTSFWPSAHFVNGISPISPEQIVAGLSSKKIVEKVFQSPPKWSVDVSSGQLTGRKGDLIAGSEAHVSMQLPGQIPRTHGIAVLFAGFCLGIGAGVKDVCHFVLRPTEPTPSENASLTKRQQHQHLVTRGLTAGIAFLLVVSFITRTTGTFLSTDYLKSPVLLCALTAIACGLLFGHWITGANRSVVFLLAQAVRSRTLMKALPSLTCCVLLGLPGLYATHRIENAIVNSGSLLPHDFEFGIPDIEGYRPTLRPPVLSDGMFQYFLGIPVVDRVRFSTDERRIRLARISTTVTFVVNGLRLLFFVTNVALTLMLFRVLTGIILRVAATHDTHEVIYGRR